MRFAVLAASLVLLALTTSPLRGQSTVEWHGYGQFRYTRGSNTAGFHLRRAKLWVKGPVPGVDQLSFKIQGIYRNGAAGTFVLQDFFAEYHGPFGRLRLGQMIPDFSLQRSQPDFLVPLVERAGVVDALIPGAMTLARDLGAQISLGAGTSPLYLLTPEDQLVLSVERLNTPRSDRDEDPWYIGGFNHLFFNTSDARSAGHTRIPDGSDGRIPTKLMADLRVQPTSTGTEYGASVQLQFFLH